MDELEIETNKAFYKALTKIESVTKNAEGYGYDYAQLPTVIEEVQKVCKDNGLQVSLPMTNEDSTGRTGVNQLIIHKNGYVKDFGPAFFNQEKLKTMSICQSEGATNTYIRRYAMVSLFNIPIQDNDAHHGCYILDFSSCEGQSLDEVGQEKCNELYSWAKKQKNPNKKLKTFMKEFEKKKWEIPNIEYA